MRFARSKRSLEEYREGNRFWTIHNYSSSLDLHQELMKRNLKWAQEDRPPRRRKRLHLAERKARTFKQLSSSQSSMIILLGLLVLGSKRTRFLKRSINEFSQKFLMSTWATRSFKNREQHPNPRSRLKRQSLNWTQQRPKIC